jgi:hypothetical protein
MAEHGDYADILAGAILTIGADTYVVQSVAFNGHSAAKLRRSHTGHTDRVHRYFAGMREPGELTFTVQLKPSWIVPSRVGTTVDVKLQFPPNEAANEVTGAGFEGEAIFQSWDVNGDLESATSANVTLAFTGPWTAVAATT